MNNAHINSGDKFVATKKTFFFDKGDIVNVTSVNEYGVAFTYNENNTTFMDFGTFKNHFEKVEEEENKNVEMTIARSVATEHVQDIVDNSEFEIFTVFDKCTVVACRLPNGFVIVESSACVSPENYNEETGVEICFNKIVDKIYELDGYNLQNELYNTKNNLNNKNEKHSESKSYIENEKRDYCDCNDCHDIELDIEFDEDLSCHHHNNYDDLKWLFGF